NRDQFSLVSMRLSEVQLSPSTEEIMTKPVSKTMFLAVIGGGYLVAIVLMVVGFVAMIGGAAAAQNANGSSSEPAMNAAIAGGMGMFFLAMACMWVPMIAFFILMYKA